MEFTEDRILTSLSRNAEAIQRNAWKASGSPEYESLQDMLNINTPNSINTGFLHSSYTELPLRLLCFTSTAQKKKEYILDVGVFLMSVCEISINSVLWSVQ